MPTDFRQLNLAQVFYVIDYVLQGKGRESITPNMAQQVFEKGSAWRENTQERYTSEPARTILYLDALARMQEITRNQERPQMRM